MQQYISQLNEAQQQPVFQKDGPMIIIAGAGSGKTRVLTVRISYLMSLGVDAFNILALTFTNKAAREMKLVGTAIAAIRASVRIMSSPRKNELAVLTD